MRRMPPAGREPQHSSLQPSSGVTASGGHVSPDGNSRAVARSVCRLERVTDLIHPPRLIPPTTAVRDSYLAGERADCLARGAQEDWLRVLNAASEDFDTFVAERRGVHTRWDVPSTIYWYVSGEHYIGTLVVRHRLTTELAEVGGHIGYNVVAPWQRQGHATRMLSAGLVECRRLGLDRVLLTCATENEPSRRVILANGGVFDGQCRGEERYWIDLTPPGSSDDQATAAGTGK